ncbi:MAG: winged helix-turn-helix domain-containing protein [Caldilineaceae bacterium]
MAINLPKRSVTVRGEEVKLTPKEFELLRTLIANSDRVLEHNYLLKQVWGSAYIDQVDYLRLTSTTCARRSRSIRRSRRLSKPCAASATTSTTAVTYTEGLSFSGDQLKQHRVDQIDLLIDLVGIDVASWGSCRSPGNS